MLEAILSAALDLPEVIYPDGSTVLEEGQNPAPLLVLIRGTVLTSRGDVPISTVSEPGSIFGEIAALLSVPATATVITRGECAFRVCTVDQFDFLQSHPEISLAVAQLLARRVDALTRYLVDIRDQYGDQLGHLSVMDTVLGSLSQHHSTPFEPGSDRESEAPY